MDFPRAWQLARASQNSDHDPRCSWIVGEHGLLCDCHVLTKHPEYEQNTTVDGEPYAPTVLVPRPKAEPWPEDGDDD